jgi:hypothetical protein
MGSNLPVAVMFGVRVRQHLDARLCGAMPPNVLSFTMNSQERAFRICYPPALDSGSRATGTMSIGFSTQ